ncbi:sodium- and chloride-dependent glycine transporter 1 [Lingula anatina]|uniref:Transporter n=1 Tax=Lingula anatina TaxID=7574 RepID=A0A1S3INW9_LINAN|nr:sodium- and chloride-dependent glycine transporter 1 [Lingula anatina]|eukprot:XP_013399591.1 sodium- and chloride-dependent glycine transporter 1 [Lingula anatina]
MTEELTYAPTTEEIKDPEKSLTTETSEDGDENQERGNWGSKLEFVCSCLSFAVGLGNIWRFPYICYVNGGGAFLLPFTIMLVLAGIPLMFMELSFGQYASQGVISVWQASPLFQGIGYGMFMVSTFIALYYNMVIAYNIFYLFASFNSDVPWRFCGNEWNTQACGVLNKAAEKNCTAYNGTYFNDTCYSIESHGWDIYNYIQNVSNLTSEEELKRVNPSDEFFHNYVLDITEGFHDMGGVRWQLALCLLLAWTIVGLCLIKGIKSSGKVAYFTAFFPYVVLLVLLIRGLTLPGSVDGIKYYVTPQWHLLGRAKVWSDAAVQIFFSLSPGWGGLITLASYNKFHNNSLRDAFIVGIGDCLTSFFAGFVIFAVIGYMAHDLQVDVTEVVSKGPGLAFIVYPEVVKRLPLSPFWAISFFLMMITLGMGTQFATVNTMHTTLLDLFPEKLRKGHRPTITLSVICGVMYLLGLTMTSKGGLYMLTLMDNYAGTYSLLFIVIAECLALSWSYGSDRFLKNISQMIGRHPGIYWKYLWQYITPCVLLFIMFFTWYDFTPSSYRDYVFPVWADVLGWMVSLTSPLMIPIVATVMIITARRDQRYQHMTLWQIIKMLTRPTEAWGPALEVHRREAAESSTRMVPMVDMSTMNTNNTVEKNNYKNEESDAKEPLTNGAVDA